MIAESYERIHRSNLVGMGILPLQFAAGETAASLGPDRRGGLRDRRACRRCCASGFAGGTRADRAGDAAPTARSRSSGRVVRIDTPQEVAYYQHGGILQYVLRQLAST